ncbi:MAG: response regulator [Acidobacteria bacterium]|nr:response regulator [Acidobacteriota bacterium]
MHPSAQGPRRHRVLLVEDHLDTRDMYAWSLEASGFDVLTASDADGAFALAADKRPDVVITDFWLPGGPSGADLCNRLKLDVRTAAIPTLMVTGSTQRQTAQNALSSGCAVVRLKPYLPDALERDVRLLIAGERLATS